MQDKVENEAVEVRPQVAGSAAAVALLGINEAAKALPQSEGDAATTALSGIVNPGQNGTVPSSLTTCWTCTLLTTSFAPSAIHVDVKFGRGGKILDLLLHLLSYNWCFKN
jgi:hypothetical protein